MINSQFIKIQGTNLHKIKIELIRIETYFLWEQLLGENFWTKRFF